MARIGISYTTLGLVAGIRKKSFRLPFERKTFFESVRKKSVSDISDENSQVPEIRFRRNLRDCIFSLQVKSRTRMEQNVMLAAALALLPFYTDSAVTTRRTHNEGSPSLATNVMISSYSDDFKIDFEQGDFDMYTYELEIYFSFYLFNLFPPYSGNSLDH